MREQALRLIVDEKIDRMMLDHLNGGGGPDYVIAMSRETAEAAADALVSRRYRTFDFLGFGDVRIIDDETWRRGERARLGVLFPDAADALDRFLDEHGDYDDLD